MLNYVIIIIFRKLDAITFCAFVLDSVSVVVFITALYLVLKTQIILIRAVKFGIFISGIVELMESST